MGRFARARVEHGDTSPRLERVLTDLADRMTFGDAVDSPEEQQRHELDRAQAERVTCRVCDEAEAYLVSGS